MFLSLLFVPLFPCPLVVVSASFRLHDRAANAAALKTARDCLINIGDEGAAL
jgi:hypothetical protein